MAPKTKKTSTPAWSKFQVDVAGLFRISGYDVQPDFMTVFKKVDLVISERRFGKQHRTAVECKYWQGRLSQADVTNIYANYLPLVQNGVLDDILIVTKESLTDTAAAMVDSSSHLSHLTYAELNANIIDFRQYLVHLTQAYTSDGLNRYYIPASTDSDGDIEQFVLQWVNSDAQSNRPIAVLGTYGMGKSTLARHIAAKFAAGALLDPSKRIPILIRLGDIAKEMSLEGLLGKLFTATNHVRNYNFATFEALNRLGHFLIIFDGFDEMKQLLSWPEFRSNLKEINRVVQGDSRVIILGRPTAFLTDAEQQYALHGKTKVATHEFREPGWPDYHEIQLAPFTKKQIQAFLPKYLEYLIDQERKPEDKAQFKHWISCDLESILGGGGEIWEIVKRPVQLKMFIEILPFFRGDLKTLTVHELYNHFIYQVIEREVEKKKARGAFDAQQRRSFARGVALWLWRERKERAITVDVIPRYLVEPYCQAGENLEAATRDLVSACVLDRQGDRLYFPHRSFQEYLVAEGIHKGIIDRTIPVEDISDLLSPQVTEFLTGFIDDKFLGSISRQMGTYRGMLPLSFLKLLSSGIRFRKFDGSTPWGNLLSAVSVREQSSGHDELASSVRSIMTTTRNSRIALSVLFATLLAGGDSDEPVPVKTSRMVWMALEGLARLLNVVGKFDSSEFQQQPIREIFHRISRSRRKGGGIDVTAIYPIVAEEVRTQYFIAEWIGLADKTRNFSYRDAGLPSRILEEREDQLESIQKSIARAAKH